MQASAISVRLHAWNAAKKDAQRIRELVFVDEQGIARELEMDEHDARCEHALAYAADGRAVGTGRLLPDGHVGRMAVLKAWRGKGVGGLLLQALVERARQRGHADVRLNAQVDVVGFYRRYGFEAFGPEFEEAGIRHIAMRRAFMPRPGGSADSP